MDIGTILSSVILAMFNLIFILFLASLLVFTKVN